MCNIDPIVRWCSSSAYDPALSLRMFAAVTFVLIFQGEMKKMSLSEPGAHFSCGNPYLFLSPRRVPSTTPRNIDSQPISQGGSTSSSTETTSSESSPERSGSDEIDEKPAPAPVPEPKPEKPERKRRAAKPTRIKVGSSASLS